MKEIKTTGIKNKCENLFYLYIQNQISTSDLINGLEEIEKQVSEKKPNSEKNGNLWFKFGKDDTNATTIKNLKSYLNLPHYHINRKFIEEQIGMIIDDPNTKLFVFYS